MRPARGLARLVCLIALGPASAGAQESPGKSALIAELIELSTDSRTETEMANLFLLELRGVFPEVVEQVVSTEPGLEPEELERLRQHLGDFDAFAAEFRARFAESVDLARLLGEIYAPLVDQSFSEDELRDIVAFYRSPSGRKTLELMPGVMQEGLRRTMARVEPRVTALVGETLAGRRAELAR